MAPSVKCQDVTILTLISKIYQNKHSISLFQSLDGGRYFQQQLDLFTRKYKDFLQCVCVDGCVHTVKHCYDI